MASISEPDRAKLFIALSNTLGKDEAQTLSSALNLDNQLATRDELRTEVMSVREDVREFEHRTDARFTKVDQRFDQLDSKMDSRFASVDVRFVELESKMDVRFAELESKMDVRFAELESKMDSRFASVDSQFAKVDSQFAKVDSQFAKVDSQLAQLAAKIGGLSGEFESKLNGSTRTLFLQLLGLQISAAALVVAVSKIF
jgi:chromosome segregation ATPase